MNESIHVLEISVRLRRSDFVAASPDKVGPKGGSFTKFVKDPG
ncbi:hypothetical protein [Opitutus terrae]|uniref:Uncharacterized protein n=1 Tax=Opitutus terrae (strain DSM 11246 / JCM 15787 / PB90-1) TaxID=452637 RepID=B1ZQ86_OPITP|nr:hypothetical protein [Opitutus terrae]ACB73566.1 hypothetical protein Oter_0276 [Opitutus terrae PB90-1]